MTIHVKLMGVLRSRLPADSQAGKATLQLDSGLTISGLLEHFGLAHGQVHLVLVNGEMAADRSRPLSDGDEVTVFPPVAGGQGE